VVASASDPDAALQIVAHLADDTAAEQDARLQGAVVAIAGSGCLLLLIPRLPIRLAIDGGTASGSRIKSNAGTAHVQVKGDAHVVEQLHQLAGIHVDGVRNQQKVVVLIQIVVRYVLDHMERSATLPRVREAHNVLQLVVGLHTVRIDEELDLVDQVGGGAVEGRREGVDVLLRGHHPDEELLADPQLRGVVAWTNHIFHLKRRKGFSMKWNWFLI